MNSPSGAPAPSKTIAEPVIYIDAAGQLVSRVSAEQVLAVLGPVLDQMRAQVVIDGVVRTRNEGPFSALYGIRYLARTLEEARTIAENAFVTAAAKASQVSEGTAGSINKPDQKNLS